MFLPALSKREPRPTPILVDLREISREPRRFGRFWFNFRESFEMESLGVYTPPPLENHDEFAQSLQLCPTSLLSLVANGLRRYVDDIKYAGRQKGLSYDSILDFCRPYEQRAADVSDLALKRRARENAHVAHSKEDLDSASSPGGRRDSNVGGGAPVSVSTPKTATKPFVKPGASVLVRRRAGNLEYGPLQVITAGQYFLRVRNPVSGVYGRVCRKKYDVFDWRPPLASRSLNLESGVGSRSRWSSWSPRSGTWSCPILERGPVPVRPCCCSQVWNARVDPAPCFGPKVGRYRAASHHTSVRRTI